MGHPDWKDCEIELFAAFEDKELNKEVKKLNELIDKGRIPISQKNVQRIPWNRQKKQYETLVTEHSENADIVLMGFSLSKLAQEQGDFFKRFPKINDILFVRAGQKIVISDAEE